jgi:hypothetical protein
MHPSYPLKTGFEQDIVRSRHIHCYAVNNPFTVKFTKRSMNRRVRYKQKQLIKEEMKDLTITLTQEGKEDIVRNTTFTDEAIKTLGEELLLRRTFDSFIKEAVSPECTVFNMGTVHITVANPLDLPPQELLKTIIDKATYFRYGMVNNQASYVELTPNEEREAPKN